MSAAGLARPCGHMFGVGQRSIANHGTGAAENTSSEVERTARARASGPQKWASGPQKWASRPARVAQSGRFGAEWALCWADTGATRTHRGRLEGPTGRVHAGPTRSDEWGHGRPTRGGEGGDSVRRVARAGSHSAERVGARHYRARRHFLCGPFLLGKCWRNYFAHSSRAVIQTAYLPGIARPFL